jgi:hypothetical protein
MTVKLFTFEYYGVCLIKSCAGNLNIRPLTFVGYVNVHAIVLIKMVKVVISSSKPKRCTTLTC